MAARLLSARTTGFPNNTEMLCEFDEEDVWNLHSVSSEIDGKHETVYKSPIKPSSNIKRAGATSRMIPAAKPSPVSGNKVNSSSSAPVNIPDWSKILREDFSRSRGGGVEYEEEEDAGGDGGGGSSMIPPHELVARVRMASFSVHQGVGRTLKGRDLSRVRNAIWKQTGFQD
ncbi:uncharacterized protein LOC116252935 [Nymphaea colorata]|uniref:Senescence regulator S40 n=1 Tax=Nymphaea colorata TaxID=210225 RepID=A0A5K1D8U6_9MAGN|nr:uncharacterized protein LOC116252935 [Nymphaea colorata]